MIGVQRSDGLRWSQCLDCRQVPQTVMLYLYNSNLGVDIEVSFTRRLGTALNNRVQPLLVGLMAANQAEELIRGAKLLRRSTDPTVRDNVYINHNLTKLESKLAYKDRCRRRLRAGQRDEAKRPTVACNRSATVQSAPHHQISGATGILRPDAAPFYLPLTGTTTLMSASTSTSSSSAD